MKRRPWKVWNLAGGNETYAGSTLKVNSNRWSEWVEFNAAAVTLYRSFRRRKYLLLAAEVNCLLLRYNVLINRGSNALTWPWILEGKSLERPWIVFDSRCRNSDGSRSLECGKISCAWFQLTLAIWEEDRKIFIVVVIASNVELCAIYCCIT